MLVLRLEGGNAEGIAGDLHGGPQAADADAPPDDGERLADLVTEEENAGDERNEQDADRPADDPGFPAHLSRI
jgi:hypothetical protein